jgi:hypothetical protein
MKEKCVDAIDVVVKLESDSPLSVDEAQFVRIVLKSINETRLESLEEDRIQSKDESTEKAEA